MRKIIIKLFVLFILSIVFNKKAFACGFLSSENLSYGGIYKLYIYGTAAIVSFFINYFIYKEINTKKKYFFIILTFIVVFLLAVIVSMSFGSLLCGTSKSF